MSETLLIEFPTAIAMQNIGHKRAKVLIFVKNSKVSAQETY